MIKIASGEIGEFGRGWAGEVAGSRANPRLSGHRRNAPARSKVRRGGRPWLSRMQGGRGVYLFSIGTYFWG
jgi:hypothetical protein